MRKYILEVVIFISGTSVMILEIVASRILAPYIGTSIIVWTSLIGVILASLSLGYFWGGKLADRLPKYFLLRNLFFCAGLYLFFVSLYGSQILGDISGAIYDTRVASVASAVALFCLPTVFLGMVTPFALQLKLKSLRRSGSVAGGLYAVSTVGSILGTFWTGFYLLGQLGSRNILVLVALLLLFCALFSNVLSEKGKELWFLILTLAILGILFLPRQKSADPSIIVDLDTSYSRVIVKTGIDKETGKETIGLSKGKFMESYGYQDEVGMPGYYNYYDLAFHFNPGIDKALMIGGAGYIYPRYFLKAYPDKRLDVVEIDPALTPIAQKYFNLKESPGLRVYHQDARRFIDTGKEEYGAILIDAFDTDATIPFQLTSLEAVRGYYRRLNGDGLVVMNIVGQIEGVPGKFLRSEYQTFKRVFPFVALYPRRPENVSTFHNIMLVASKVKLREAPPKDERMKELLGHLWEGPVEGSSIILTDDFAPVEQMLLTRGDWKYF